MSVKHTHCNDEIAKRPTSNTPVCDPLWPDNLFPFEVLNFAVGQVIGDDVGGLGARIVDVELAAVQHHQPAQLIGTGLCKIITFKSQLFCMKSIFIDLFCNSFGRPFLLCFCVLKLQIANFSSHNKANDLGLPVYPLT